MRCSRCECDNARYTVEYSTNFGKVKEYLCENCYAKNRSTQARKSENSTVPALRCPFCGNSMEDYLHTGLVGCSQCYAVFVNELAPYVVRLQGNGEHRGKEPSQDPKYEAAQTLRELLVKQKRASQAGKHDLALKLSLKAAELKLVLFGDDEEE